MENYLNLDLELHSKKAMAEIRVSAHNLEIERGRKKQAEISTCKWAFLPKLQNYGGRWSSFY